MSVLPKHWRIGIKNNAGTAADVTVVAEPWSIDPSTGKVTYATAVTVFSATGANAVTSGTYNTSGATAQDNSTTGYMGAKLFITASHSDATTQSIEVWLEGSDDGTTWPAAEKGDLVRVLQVPNGSATNHQASL